MLKKLQNMLSYEKTGKKRPGEPRTVKSNLENSLQCFEYWSGLNVTVHDLTGRIRQILPQERFSHRCDKCCKEKLNREKQCRTFDIQMLQNEVWAFNTGGYKLCHAGLLEWVMPIIDSGRRLGIIFAGVTRPPRDLKQLHPCLTAVVRRGINPDDDFDPVRAGWIMEALRILSVTVIHDIREYDHGQLQHSPGRKEVIHRFIGEYCDRKDLLERLARKLYLSVPRTVHVVKEETGYTFQQLHKAYQMRLAAARLRFSNESIAYVASQCGFEDVSSLHRNFKKYFKTTPLAYRKQYSSESAPPEDIMEIGDWPGRPR